MERREENASNDSFNIPTEPVKPDSDNRIEFTLEGKLASKELIYVASEEDKELTDLFESNPDMLDGWGKMIGFHVIYLPLLIKRLANKEVLQYRAPYLREAEINKINIGNDFMLRFLDNPSDRSRIKQGFIRTEDIHRGTDGNDKAINRFYPISSGSNEPIVDQLHNIGRQINIETHRAELPVYKSNKWLVHEDIIDDEQRCLEKPTRNADDQFVSQLGNESINDLLEEVKERIAKLRQRGISQYILEQLIHPDVRAQEHAQTEFSVVLEQGVCPSRAMTLVVLGVRHSRSTAAPDGGAARSIGHHHAVTEELGHELSIRRLTAACAGAGELEERLFKLGAQNRRLLHRVLLRRNLLGIYTIIEELLLGFELIIQRLHIERLHRADLCAVAAAQAVHGGNSYREVIILDGLRLFGREAFRSILEFFFRREYGTDSSMRADEGALVAADALVRIPNRYIDSRTAFFESSTADRERTIYHVFRKLGNRQLVAFLTVHDFLNFGDEGRSIFLFHRFVCSISPGSRYFDAMEGFDTLVDGAVVHVDDLLALLAVGRDDGILEVLDRRVDGE